MYIYSKQFHRDAYFVALIIMIASIPLWRYAMSVMQFTLLGLWIWAGFSFKHSFELLGDNNLFRGIGRFLAYMGRLTARNFVGKFRIFFRNKAAMVLVSLFFIHVIGLIGTTDFAYAMKDLRTKLPLLALPIILVSMEKISRQRFFIIMLAHAGAVFVGTLISSWRLLGGEFNDIREIIFNISHIRFSLNLCIAVFSLIYFIFLKNYFKVWTKLIFALGALWLISFLMVLESGIGLITLLTITVLLLIYQIIRQKNPYLRFGLTAFVIIVPLALILYVYDIVREFNQVEPVNFEQLDKHTALGNKYWHDTTSLGIEDGRYVGLYVAYDELGKAWNQKSEFKFEGKDKMGQDIKYTLIRFLTSKGYRKDAEGVSKLTEEEVDAIERGIANVNYLKNPSLRTRISKIMIGYHNFKYAHDPNGSSILQRIEYWKASVNLIKQHFWFGVGTGDVNSAFDQYYKRTDSPLKESNRYRSHNQYLSIWVALGFFGFLWFLFSLIYPPLKEKKLTEYFYFIFFVTILLSMLTEDTIETQAGVTLFAFFNAFLLFGRKEQTDEQKGM